MQFFLHLFAYLIVFLLFNSIDASSKINKRRLLLPFNSGVPTNYTLEILNTDNGCYIWTTSRNEVASVEPIFDDVQQRLKKCSTKALVTVNSKVKKRLSTIILAQDTLSSNVFRADVEVDLIKSIEIVTTTKEIALEDVPDIIEVTGKDAKNDTFTSLGGVEFEWQLSPILTNQNGKTDQSINLKFKKFSDSQFKVKPDIEYWERRNSQGYMVLLEGIRTGSTKLSVRIKDKEYADSDMQIPEINLIVIANLALIPAHDVYLVPYANIQYNVQMIKSGKMSLIEMPSEQYVLELSNYIVASLNEQKSIVTATLEGSTSLILRDTNIIKYNEEEITHPSVDIFVAKPSYILLKVNPGTNFALQEFTNYEISVEIYDQNHHSMYLSDNLNLKVTIPSKYFLINESSKNQAKNIVRTINTGKCTISAKLYGTIQENGYNYDLDKPIEIEQDVIIYPALTVTPSNLLLPWDPILRPNYDFQLSADGGTGSYRWQTTNINLTSVQLNSKNRESSIVSVFVKGLGKTSFNVTDVTNYVFSSQVNVSVQPIVELDSPKSILETHLGEILYVPIALYGDDYESNGDENKKRLFDDCTKIKLNVEIVEKTRFTYIPDDDNPLLGFKNSCKLLQFKCTSIGHSRVWVSYDNGDGEPLKIWIMISCHLPLRLIHPANSYALLALGTSIELAFEGGPKAWPLLKNNHYSTLKINDENEQNLIYSELIVDPYRYKKDLHVFRIECRKLGSSNLTLEVSNLKSATLPNPSKETIDLEVFCDEPQSVYLKVKLKADENCPLFNLFEDGELNKLKEQKIPVSASNQIEIELIGRNSQGKTFNNLSSISVNWNIEAKNNQNDEIFKNFVLNDFTEEVNGANGYRKLSRNFISLPAFGKEGNVLVNSNLMSYKSNYLEKQGISNSKTDYTDIKASLLLDLVERHRIDRDEISVFNYKKNKEYIYIKKGSGHFQVEPSSFDFANLTYSETLKRISLTPLKDGIFTIKVTDNCVDYGLNYPYTSVLIKIVNPKGINIVVADKVELGKEVDVMVTLLDTKGEIIPSKFHSKINLQAIINSDIATIRPKNPTDQNIQSDSYSVYTLKAEKVGTCSLAFKTGGKNVENIIYQKNITSGEKAINIFEPVRIHPENLTLIVGSRYQVAILGGPQSDSNNHYTSEDENIATVDSSGILNALKLGTTILNVKSIGANNLIYSQFTSKVTVLPLKGVKLKIPTKNILSGSVVPAVIYGLVDSNNKDGSLTLIPPDRFGTALPNLKFEWIISNKNIIQLESLYNDLSLSKKISSELNNFAVRIKALQPGEVSLKIIVSSSNQTDPTKQQLFNNELFSDEVTIKIISKLELINIESPTNIARTILMSPNSHVSLKTSLDGLHNKLEIKIIKSLNNKIKLLPNSILKAEDFDEAIVEIRSHQEEAIETSQILLLKIICKPVSYLLARPISQFKFLKNDLIPIGLDLKFEIKYFDSIGNQFSSVNNNIEFKSSTLDSISFGVYRNENNNYDFNVKSLSSGLTTLQITDKNHEMIEDYLLFRTGQLIEPSNEQGINLTIGDVICFQSPVINLLNSNEKVFWSLDKKYESNVNLIEPKDNIALLVVKNEGDVKLDFVLGTNEKLSSSELKIRSPKSVDLDLKQTSFLSSSLLSDAKKEILIPVVIDKEEANFKDFKCNSMDRVVNFSSPFTCELTFTKLNNIEMLNTLLQRELNAEDLFRCKVIYSFVTNQNYIQITASKFYFAIPSLDKFLPYFENNISIQLYLKNRLVVEKEIPFYPAFKSNLDKIILSNKSPTATVILQVSNLLNNSIEAMPCNDKTRSVLDIYKLDGNEQLAFEIHLKRISSLYDDEDTDRTTIDEPICLKLYSALSKQIKLIPVELKLYADGSECLKKLERQPILNSNRSFIRFCYLTYYYIVDYSQTMIFSILTTIGLLFLGYYFLNKRSNENNVPLLEMHHFSTNAPKVSPFSSPINQRSTTKASTVSASRLLNYSQSAVTDNLNTSISNLSLSNSSPKRTNTSSSLLSPSSPRAGRPLWSARI